MLGTFSIIQVGMEEYNLCGWLPHIWKTLIMMINGPAPMRCGIFSKRQDERVGFGLWVTMNTEFGTKPNFPQFPNTRPLPTLLLWCRLKGLCLACTRMCPDLDWTHILPRFGPIIFYANFVYLYNKLNLLKHIYIYI